MQSLKIGYFQGFCIIGLAIRQNGQGRDFFPRVRARDRLPARLSFTRKSPLVLAFSSQVMPPIIPAPTAHCRCRRDDSYQTRCGFPVVGASLNSWCEATVFCRDGVPREFCSGRRRWCCSRSRYMARRKSGSRGDRETHTIGLLPNRARLGIYAKFALSFAKLPKIQTPNAKPLDTSFL